MPLPLPALLRLVVCLVVPLLTLASCFGRSWPRPFAAPVLEVSYDDLGTPSALRPVLGSRGPDPSVRIHHGPTRTGTTPRLLNSHQALLMLRRNERALPQTSENAPLRQRMRVAYRRVYELYRTRRDAIQAVPPFGGRSAMGRMQMLPPMPPSL